MEIKKAYNWLSGRATFTCPKCKSADEYDSNIVGIYETRGGLVATFRCTGCEQVQKIILARPMKRGDICPTCRDDRLVLEITSMEINEASVEIDADLKVDFSKVNIGGTVTGGRLTCPKCQTIYKED